jgi:hypothetical protein
LRLFRRGRGSGLGGGLIGTAPSPHAPAPLWGLRVVAAVVGAFLVTLLVAGTGAVARSGARISSGAPLVSLTLGTTAPALLGKNRDRQGHDPGEGQSQTSHEPSRFLHGDAPYLYSQCCQGLTIIQDMPDRVAPGEGPEGVPSRRPAWALAPAPGARDLAPWDRTSAPCDPASDAKTQHPAPALSFS